MFPEGRLLDFLIVGAVALIVVGPKDLPMLMRKVGQFMAKVRGMAAEFRASFDELARQSELDELRKEVQSLRTANPLDFVAGPATSGDALGDIHTDLTGVHAEMTALTSPATETPPPAEPVAATAPEPTPEPTPKAPAS